MHGTGWVQQQDWGADQEEPAVSLLNARRPFPTRLSMPSFTPGAPIPFLHFLHPSIYNLAFCARL